MWEIPAGLLEEGRETPQRGETRTPRGQRVDRSRWRYLGPVYPTPGYSTERTHLFLALGVRATPTARSEADGVGFFKGHRAAKTFAALDLALGPRSEARIGPA